MSATSSPGVNLKARLRLYFQLVKPGIIAGNLLTAAAGFLYGNSGRPAFGRAFGLLIGTGLIIGAACAVNNVLDRDLDAKMTRTAKRALVVGQIQPQQALIFAAALLIGGSLLLLQTVGSLTLAVGLFGFFQYVLIYTRAKRWGSYGTLLGSLAGAAPPLAGYSAATGRLDLAGGWLFLLLVIWQMPHFYAIALYRAGDYKAAGVPVLPVTRGRGVTKKRLIAYVVAFILTIAAMPLMGLSGYVFAIAMTLAGLWWLGVGLKPGAYTTWGRSMFLASLRVITAWALLLPLARRLP